jgi:large subunit ribosomal protein L7Ae
MAKSYVKFEVTKEVAGKTIDALRLAKQTGSVRKGINEVTKSVERGLALLVVMAEDIDPEEVAMHIPSLCDQKKIPYAYVPTKIELGNSIGLNVPCSSVAIEKAGEGEHAMKEVISKVTGKSQGQEKPQKEPAPKPQKEKAEKHEKTEKQAEKPAEKEVK